MILLGVFLQLKVRKASHHKNYNFTIKIKRHYKIVKKISKNTSFINKTVERSLDGLDNYPRCVLWQRCRFGLNFWIKILVREINLGWVFSGMGSPSTLGVRRDEGESAGTVV